MWSLLQSPMAMKLTLALLHFVWQGLLLLCAWRIASAIMPQKTAAARYNGALATLCLMLICPVLTFMALDTWDLPSHAPLPLASAKSVDADASSLIEQAQPADEVSRATSLIAEDSLPESDPRSSASWISTCQPYFMLLWLGGIVLLGLRICLSYLGTVWLRNVGLPPVETDVLIRFSHIARQLNVIHLPPIAFSSRISQAMTVGLMRPMVLLPVAWMTEISPDVLEAVLAHELAHVRRCDLWINFLQRVAETLFFYHPAVWMISAEIRRQRESCCDELAVEATGQRLDYAKSLHEVAYWQMVHGSPSLAVPFLGPRRGELLGRVRHILGITPPKAGERSWPAGLILVGAPLSLWAVSAIFFPEISPQAAAEDPPREETESLERIPFVPPHHHLPPPGFPPPHFLPPPPPRDGRPPHLPPHLRPPLENGERDDVRPGPPGDLPPADELNPMDPAVRRALRSLRQQVRELRQEVEDLKQEQEEEPPARRRRAARKRAAEVSPDAATLPDDSDT